MPRQQIAQNDKQEIGIVIAFVHFVDDQMRPLALKRRLDRQTTAKKSAKKSAACAHAHLSDL